MSTDVTEEELWSWIDRDAPELDAWLERHPERRAEVDAVRGCVRGLESLSAELPVPPSIGPYRVLRLLGSGGMGLVYEVEQPSPRRRVAVKVIRGSSLADTRQVALFQREVRALGRLKHPSIAAIHEAGQTSDGLHYFAMELVDGAPLSEFARRENLSLRKRLGLFQRVCEAVQNAHDNGVVHRDLKPANILVERDGTPKILDFGLARLAEGDLSFSIASTDPGRILGTLPYMSPEQARGESDVVDERSDVYSLGVILYELLTDRLPLDVTNTSFMEAVRTISDRTPKRPGALRRLSRELDAVVLRALDKDPRRRYADAGDLGADVARHLAGEPVRAQAPTLRYRFRKLVGRHKAVSILALLALLVSTWGGWQWVMRPDYGAQLRGSWHPEVSPYTDIRWKGTVPEVLLDKEWYELLSLDGLRVGAIVEFCKQTTPEGTHRWRRRFEEDLWQVIWRMGRFPGLFVDLSLRQNGVDSAQSRMWSLDHRQELIRTRSKRLNRLPFTDVRFPEGRAEVLVEGAWYDLIEIEGVETGVVLMACRDLGGDWRDTFRTRLVDVLADLGVDAGGGALLRARDLSTGGDRWLDQPMTVTAFEAALASVRRTPFDEPTWTAHGLRARLDGVWYDVLELEGRSIEELLEAARTVDPRRERLMITRHPVRVLRAVGIEPTEVAHLRVRSLESERVFELEAAWLDGPEGILFLLR